MVKARVPTDHIGMMEHSYLTDQPPSETHDSTSLRMAVGLDPYPVLSIHHNLACINRALLLIAMRLKY